MSVATVLVSFAWGFAEATLFFVVPDVVIGWIALRLPRRAEPAWMAATAGGTIGALVTYAAVRRGWDPDAYFAALPGVRPGDIERVRLNVARDPARAFLSAAVTGQPVKLLASAAAREEMPAPRIGVLVLLNRAPRLAVFRLLLGGAGLLATRLALGPRSLAVLYALGWAFFYGWYWLGRRHDRA